MRAKPENKQFLSLNELDKTHVFVSYQAAYRLAKQTDRLKKEWRVQTDRCSAHTGDTVSHPYSHNTRNVDVLLQGQFNDDEAAASGAAAAAISFWWDVNKQIAINKRKPRP